MNEAMKITFSSSIEKLCEVNSSFDAGVLKVAYHGRNRNGSCIPKEAFERSMATIYNCPLVCNYNREYDEIGGHDVEVVRQEDGKVKLVNITHPIGLVPESSKPYWREYEDQNGVHEYLCVDVLIWKRQEAYEKIRNNQITDESMEIRVKSGHMEDGVLVIEEFEFLAFCLLESDQPCYESASLILFSADDFKEKHAQMMEDLKESFQKINTSNGVDIHPEKLTEGGEEHLEQKMELLTRFGLSAEQLDFDTDAMSVDELAAELEARFGEKKPEGESVDNPMIENQFSLTAEQLREQIIEALGAEKVTTEWGEMCRYCYCDYDASAMEIFAWDAEDWRLYGFTYSMNGDSVVVDFASKKRKKFSIVDFDEGDVAFSYKAMFEPVAEASAFAKASELNAAFEVSKSELEEKYNAASDTIREMDVELDSLRKYQQEQMRLQREADEETVFAMFEDLNGVEAFEALRGDCAGISIDDLEDKCFAIRGRMQAHTFSVQKQKPTRLPIEKAKPTADDEPYKGLFLEFPPHGR